MRNHVGKEFKEIYFEAERSASALSMSFYQTPSMPLIVSRQSNRNKTPASNPEDYFRASAYIVLLDNIISELERRFTPSFKEP